MPQIDVTTFFSQAMLILTIFFSLYMGINSLLLPMFSSKQKIREKIYKVFKNIIILSNFFIKIIHYNIFNLYSHSIQCIISIILRIKRFNKYMYEKLQIFELNKFSEKLQIQYSIFYNEKNFKA